MVPTAWTPPLNFSWIFRSFATPDRELIVPKGMATADGDYALGCRSASALQLDARKLAGLVALSEDLGHDGSERLIVEPDDDERGRISKI